MGIFQLLRETLSGFMVATFMPMESLSVIILSFAAEFTSGFAAAGALLDAGVLTIKQTVLALLIGNILAFPVRALRHQLPRYIGIFSPKMGTQILLLGQGFRIASLMMVACCIIMSHKTIAKKLRSGFTTGTAAAAATKGALCLIVEGSAPSRVRIRLLTGADIMIAIHRCRLRKNGEAICSVIKDAGDDPDVTHKAEIGARVSLSNSDEPAIRAKGVEIIISGGEGVGRVTKPGLEVDPGKPAINPGPQKMISQAIEEVMQKHNLIGTVRTEIFVPQGKKLAEKTLNARLGIIGGISILGTTGVVRPLSHDAFIATIKSALSVARACGQDRVVLTTGRRSERFAQNHWREFSPEAFIQIGDFFKLSLAAAAKNDFRHIILAVFFGKALKMAQGVLHTHAAKSSLALDTLARWTLEITRDSDLSRKISAANTARHAFEILSEHHPAVIHRVGQRIRTSAERFAEGNAKIQSVIFDYQGQIVFDSLHKPPSLMV
jgi:cobalt-precorrin-5B (C1)-methyltransferase